MHLNIRLVATLSAVLFSWGCTANDGGAPALPAMPDVTPQEVAPAGEPRIKQGDTLEIFVNEDPSFNGSYIVREKGDIIIPEVGRIAVQGFTVAEAESRVKSSLERAQLTSATVILDRVGFARESAGMMDLGTPATVIFMSGKVNKPGKHSVPLYKGRQPGIYEAILICGGMGRFADERKVTVLRSEEGSTRKTRYIIDVEKIKEGSVEDVPIAEGDIIIVKEKTFSL